MSSRNEQPLHFCWNGCHMKLGCSPRYAQIVQKWHLDGQLAGIDFFNTCTRRNAQRQFPFSPEANLSKNSSSSIPTRPPRGGEQGAPQGASHMSFRSSPG